MANSGGKSAEGGGNWDGSRILSIVYLCSITHETNIYL